ncbi:MAG: SIMPL domain-containing protein, partial [Candidatus Paceibacterota bacterium]
MNNIPKSFWNVITTAATLLVVFLAVLSIKELKSIGYVGVNANMTNTVSVEGTGEAVAIPDIATFSFSVTENAKTVDAAQTLATEKSNAALKALKDAGVDVDKDIST